MGTIGGKGLNKKKKWFIFTFQLNPDILKKGISLVLYDLISWKILYSFLTKKDIYSGIPIYPISA